MLNQSVSNTSLKIIRLVLKSSLIVFVVCGSLSLIACSKSGSATKQSASPSSGTVITPEGDSDHFHDHHSDQDIQVIVSGLYHLEFVAEPKDDGVNLDFHLENEDTHESIADAKVTARVQLPNGDEKTLDLPYESAGAHYIAFLPAPVKGQYTVTFLIEINGEQVNARFSFDQ